MNPLCLCGCGKEVRINRDSKKPNKFIRGHSNRCDDIKRKQQDSNFVKCGYRYASQSKEIKDAVKTTRSKFTPEQKEAIQAKSRKTNLEHWGCEYPMQCDKVQKKYTDNFLKNHGVKHALQDLSIYKQFENTMISRYGERNPTLLKKFTDKISQTYEQRTGYKHPSQNPDIRHKQLMGCFKKKLYILPSGKEIFLQGEEPQFLDFVFSNNLLKEEDIDYTPHRIKYKTEDKKDHYYFPDFRLICFNLIIEIRSSYILSLDPNKMNLKIAATKILGYKHCMIIDMNYDEFKKIIIELKMNHKNLNLVI